MIVIWALDKSQYAIYGIAMSVTGIMVTLADSGAAQGVFAFGGARSDKEYGLDGVIVASRQLLYRNSLYAVMIAVVVWVASAWSHVSQLTTLFSVAAIIVTGFYVSAGATLYRNALLLMDKVGYCQRVDVGVAVVRLGVLFIGLSVYSNAEAALVFTALVDAFRCYCLKSRLDAISPVGRREIPTPSLIFSIRSYIRKCFPWVAYNAFYPQILFLALTQLADSQVIAETAAFSRLHQLFLVVSTINSLVMCPFVAKVDQYAKSRFLLASSTCLILACIIGLAMYVFPWICILIIGPEYGSNIEAVRILALSSTTSVVCTCMLALSAARKLVAPPILMITANLTATIGAIYLLRPSTSVSYFWANLAVQFVTFVAFLIWFAYEWRTIAGESQCVESRKNDG